MIEHKRIRIANGRVEEAPRPFSYSGGYSKAQGWTDIRVIELPPSAVKSSRMVHEKSESVPSIAAKQAGSVLAVNASFVNEASGQLLGRTIIDGKQAFADITGKTEKREHLYFRSGGFGIGPAPTDATWASQGSPRLRRAGKSVVAEQIKIENTPRDIANGVNVRMSAGLKSDGTLVIVAADGRGGGDRGIKLDELGVVFDWLGCPDAINLDGGGSATVYSNIKQVQNALDLGGTSHISDQSQSASRRVCHAVVIDLDEAELFPHEDRGEEKMIWQGNHMFIWQSWNVYNGDIDKMIAKAKELGYTGVLIKFANGSLRGDPNSQRYMNQFKELAPKFKAAGFVVAGWIYQYLTDIGGEVEACRQAVDAGADWLILNSEAEVKGKHSEVQKFGVMIRSILPDVKIGLSSFPIVDYHPTVPWNEFAKFIDVILPQVYWANIGWTVEKTLQMMIDQNKRFGLPIAPTGQAYTQGPGHAAEPEDMQRFIELSRATGITGISWWDWQHASEEQLQATKIEAFDVQRDLPKPQAWCTYDVDGGPAQDAVIMDNKVWIPLRDVIEQLGGAVIWDNQKKHANILNK